MTKRRCARCGREPGESATDAASPSLDDASLPLIGTPEAAWASFDGQDLCPDCQTPDQRREAAGRLVAMIEREIQRRQIGKIGPDPYETALVAYAMALRARGTIVENPIDEVPAEGAPAPRPADSDPGASRTMRLRVAYTAAFLTGEPLPVRLHQYGELQRRLGSHLPDPQWSVRGLNAEGATYASGGGLSTAVPLVVARRNGADLVTSLPSIVDGTLRVGARRYAGTGPVVQATPDSVVINVYDLGVAVITAWYEVVARADDLRGTAEELRKLGMLRSAQRDQDAPVAEVLQGMARATAAEFTRAVRRALPGELPPAWLSRGRPSAGSGSAGPRSPEEEARLLWVHPIYVVDSRGGTIAELPVEPTDVLAPTFSKRIRIVGGVFVPGISWSVVAVTAWRGAEDTPVRLTELHWAYYALYLAMDRGLLGVLDQQRWSRGARLGQLEADAEMIFADYLRAMDARAKLDSALSALGGDELVVWETIAEVQRFSYLVDSVGRKLEVLEQLAQRRVAQATADRARRIGELLGILSVLTVVTVAIALLSEVVGSRGEGPGPLSVRFAVVAAAIVLSLLLYWAIYVRTAKIRSSYAVGTRDGDRRRSRGDDRDARQHRASPGDESDRVGSTSTQAR